MPRIVFVGTGPEVYPYRLLGVPVVVAGEGPGSWVARVAGEHPVVLVSETVYLERRAEVAELAKSLPEGSALTVVPAKELKKSAHLEMIREETTRALGIDAWSTAGETITDGGA